MKGINLKKIGAIVAGATILASSVAFAGGLMYQNTELVNENGEPLAKVVSGAGSLASDGVVAALISNKIANEAYKSATLTAEVVGEATCTGGADGGTGTCDIVEGSETVTLEITVPGAGVEGVHEFVGAIGDYVDRGLENRYAVSDDSDEAYTVYDDFEDEDANPFQNWVGDTLTHGPFGTTLEETAMYMIGADNFGPFHEATIVDTKEGTEYKESQAVYIHGGNRFDSGDDELYGEVNYMAYHVLFDSTGDYGLPLCPGDESDAWDAEGDWVCDDLDTLQAHKVYVAFMGGDWVFSELDNYDGGGHAAGDCDGTWVDDGEVFEVDGAIVKLAKEAVSGIVNVGEIMEAPSGYKVRLDDISREVGEGNAHPAIITVLDANDNEICQDQVFPGQTKDDLCEENTDVKLHVYQTAPGLNFIAKWAEMAIYSDEIELECGEKFLDDDDTEWEVACGFTVKDEDACDQDPEYLRELLLWTEDENDEMEAGDVFPVIDLPDYEVYDLTYNGIDDSDAEYDNLKFSVTDDEDWDVQYDTGDDDTYYVEANDSILEVTCDTEFKMEHYDHYGVKQTVRGDRFWIIDGTCDECFDTGYGAVGNIDVLIFEDDDGEYYYYSSDDYCPNDDADGCYGFFLSYKQAGSNGAFGYYDEFLTTSGTNEFGLFEDAGEWDDPASTIGNDVANSLAIGWDVDGSTGTSELGAPDWTGGLGEDDEINLLVTALDSEGRIVQLADCYVEPDFSVKGYEGGYTAPAFGACTATTDTNSFYDEGFISMRGTKFKSGSDDEYVFQVPDQLLKTTWTFSTVEAAEAEADTSTFTLHEGEEAAVGTTGVRVKVLSIDQQLTPCTMGAGAGEAPMCTPDMSTVSAVIMPNNAPSVETIVPYKLTSNLVYLDTDNVALDTGVIITVGGDAVNTVTKDAVAGSDVDFEATPVVVKQIGNKIVVAGLTAEDTMAAGEQFLAELTN